MRATVGQFEIPADDPERCARFLRSVFGWEVEPAPWGGGVYFRVRTAEPSTARAIQGGLVERGAAGIASPLPVIHLEGATLEGALERIAAAGGAADGDPVEVPGAGRFARFRDPEGNLWGLWTATE